MQKRCFICYRAACSAAGPLIPKIFEADTLLRERTDRELVILCDSTTTPVHCWLNLLTSALRITSLTTVRLQWLTDSTSYGTFSFGSASFFLPFTSWWTCGYSMISTALYLVVRVVRAGSASIQQRTNMCSYFWRASSTGRSCTRRGEQGYGRVRSEQLDKGLLKVLALSNDDVGFGFNRLSLVLGSWFWSHFLCCYTNHRLNKGCH